MSTRSVLLIGLLMEACYLAFYAFSNGPDEVLVFIGVNAVTFLLQSFLLWKIWRSPIGALHDRRLTLLILGFGALFRLTLVPHPVVGSDDVYRYLWDGKVASSGISPFEYLPTDPHLAHLASADLPAKVNHPELRSIYPPLAQVLFLASYRLFGESVAGMKLLFVLLDCCTLALLWLILRRHPRAAFALLVYAWSPLPILYFGLDGHVDALGLPFLLLFLFLFTNKRPWTGAAALGLAGLAKLVPLMIVPLLLRFGRGARHMLVMTLPFLVLATGYLLFYEPTGGLLESLTTFGSRWEFNGGLFTVAYYLSGPDNATAHRICGALIGGWIIAVALLKRPLVEKVFWCFVGFILLSPVVHPWYLTWLAALLVLRWSPAVFVFLGLSNIANIVVYQYRAFGEWNDQPMLLVIEYLPVAVLLVREIIKGEVLVREGVAAGIPARAGAAKEAVDNLDANDS